jgi:hypothetical protein
VLVLSGCATRRNPSESEAICDSTRKFPFDFNTLRGYFREPPQSFPIFGKNGPFFDHKICHKPLILKGYENLPKFDRVVKEQSPPLSL